MRRCWRGLIKKSRGGKMIEWLRFKSWKGLLLEIIDRRREGHRCRFFLSLENVGQ